MRNPCVLYRGGTLGDQASSMVLFPAARLGIFVASNALPGVGDFLFEPLMTHLAGPAVAPPPPTPMPGALERAPRFPGTYRAFDPRVFVWGGPSMVATVQQGVPLCHYGNGVGVGETFLTMARAGVGGGSNDTYWMGDLVAAPGDSGSAVVTCGPDESGVHGRGAAGILTHLSVQVCPCDVNTLTFQQGVVFGTTIERAVAMAQEAGLSLSVVLP
jgi:hypothetical protein